MHRHVTVRQMLKTILTKINDENFRQNCNNFNCNQFKHSNLKEQYRRLTYLKSHAFKLLFFGGGGGGLRHIESQGGRGCQKLP